jgi:hypothetical protein
VLDFGTLGRAVRAACNGAVPHGPPNPTARCVTTPRIAGGSMAITVINHQAGRWFAATRQCSRRCMACANQPAGLRRALNGPIRSLVHLVQFRGYPTEGAAHGAPSVKIGSAYAVGA